MSIHRASFDFPQVQNDFFEGDKTHKRRLLSSLALDFFLCGIIYLVGGLIFLLIPPLPILFSPFDSKISYPVKEDFISNKMMAVINWLLPPATIIVFSLVFFRNKWNMIYAFKGCIESLTLSFLISAVFWVTISDIRPNFVSRCNPDLDNLKEHVIYDTSICRNPLEKPDFHAFPSGHVSTAVAGWLFISLYLTNNFETWDGTGHLWKLFICIIMPLIIPIWVGITRLNDYKHTREQVLAGAVIGIITGLTTYRLNFRGFYSNVNPKHYWDKQLLP